METKHTVTFSVSTRHFDLFTHEFAKLVKKATKLGVLAPTYVVVQRDKVIPAHTETREVQGDDGRPFSAEVLVAAKVVHVITVTGQAPKLAGWTFVAALQHEEAGNIVRSVPGVDVQVRRDLRTLPPRCEHCGLDRRRSDTYVVSHDDGRQMQVGRNCLGDFTGTDSPEAIARWAELLSAFVAAVGGGDEGEGGFGSYVQVTTLDDFLPFVCCSIRTTGWLSRTASRDRGGQATADHAWMSIFPPKDAKKEHLADPQDEDRARALKVLEVARAYFAEHAVDALPDYENNVRIVVESISVEARTAGIAASIVNFAERLMGKEIERRRNAERAATSAYVGTVGKREVFTVTVEKVIDLDGAYGVSHLHLMADAAGNVVKWFGSSRLEVGTTYALKGTVRSHEEYKGVKATTITRCKVQPPKETT